MRPAVFLDRDGTIIEERGYLDRLDLLELFPWTVDAIRLVNRAGFAAVVITNQSAIGRGIIDEPFLHRVHEAIDARMAAGRARIDAYYFCPHHPDADLEAYRQTCRCRKPQPGLIERACRELQLDPSRSVMVGDKPSDLEVAPRVGARSVLVLTGYGLGEWEYRRDRFRITPDHVASDLLDAVEWALKERPS